MIYDELKMYSAEAQASPYSVPDGDLEGALLARGDRLIDLGLAQYGAIPATLKTIYERAKEPAADDADTKYKQGIRLAVLGNETVNARSIIHHFPESTLGAAEVAHVLKDADWSEAETLVLNPTVGDDVLLALYKGDKFAEGMEENRRRQLVYVSGSNPRLATNEDSYDGPDMGHYYLHKAIFEMMETVPTSKRWANSLLYFLHKLDPDHTSNADDIDAVLERWKVDEEGKPEEPEDKYYTETGLPEREELRCLIAALYGKSYKRKEVVIHGAADDEDLAKRCAFYGNASLKVKDLKEGYERDKDNFIFAAMLNDSIFHHRQVRKEFEVECLDGSHSDRYQRRLEQIKKRWPSYDTRPIADWMVGREEEKTKLATEQQVSQLQASVKELQKLAMYAPWLFIALAALVSWKT